MRLLLQLLDQIIEEGRHTVGSEYLSNIKPPAPENFKLS